MGYANFWWGLTPSAVLAMLDLARFEVTERYQTHPLNLDVVATAVEGESVVPPVEFARLHGSRRGDTDAEPTTPPADESVG
jgi:hypothetical protein